MSRRPPFIVFDEIMPPPIDKGRVLQDKAFLDELRTRRVVDGRVWVSYCEMNKLRRMAGFPGNLIKRKSRRMLVTTVYAWIERAMLPIEADLGELVARKFGT